MTLAGWGALEWGASEWGLDSPVTILSATGSLNAAFTGAMSETLTAYAAGALAAAFTASLSPIGVSLPAGAPVYVFTMSGGVSLPLPSGQLIAYFGPYSLDFRVSPPTANPGAILQWIGLQSQHRIAVGVGVPPTPLGNDGDLWFRQDGASGSRLYQRASGAWSAVA